MKFKHLSILLPLALGLALHGAEEAEAQPGMTPPGSTPPYTEPPPASPGPAGPPAPMGPPPAQPGGYAPEPYYYGPPMPPPMAPAPRGRTGFHIGLSGGLGIMESDAGEFACDGCDPVAANFELHVGRMFGSKFALQGELWFQTQSLDEFDSASINQVMYTIAAQYWLHPKFWLRAGFGAANLSLSYETGFGRESDSLDSGTAMHVGLGIEMIHSPNFSLDAIIKTGAGSYADRDETVTATTVNIGVNWY